MTTFATETAGLVGRDAEIAVVQRCLESAARGQGMLLLVSGEAGIGKTALAMVAGQRAQVAGAAFAVGRCYESGGAPAFAPWHELLSDLQTSAGFDLATLPHPFGTGVPAQTAYALMQAVAGRIA